MMIKNSKEELRKDILMLLDLLSIYSKDILNFKEAAQYMSVSESFLYKLSSKRKIAHTKPNNKLIFFKKQDLDNWLLQNPVKTAEVIEESMEKYLSREKKDKQ